MSEYFKTNDKEELSHYNLIHCLKKEFKKMSSITLKLDEKIINQMNDYYNSYKQKPVPYSHFRAKKNGVTITAYSSGKVLFQGHEAAIEAEKWQSSIKHDEARKETDKKKQSKENKLDLPPNIQALTLIGSDEVGNGSYFGALTVCAVYLDKEKQDLMRELGVKDSKDLSDKQIRKIAQDIKHTVPYHLTIVNPAKYNQLNKEYNANAIKAKLHNFTIQQLIVKLEPKEIEQLEGVLIDEFTPKNTFYRYLKNDPDIYQGQTYFARKAESVHLSVAAASIIARDAFLASLEKLGRPYGITLPSGAGKAVDLVASDLIIKNGQEVLEQTAKMHFKNTQKAFELVNKKKKRN